MSSTPSSAYFSSSASSTSRACRAVLGEIVALVAPGRRVRGASAAAGQRRRGRSDRRHRSRGRLVSASSSRKTPCCQLFDDGLLAFGLVPAFQEIIQRGELLADGLAGVILEGFSDELAVRAEVLHAFGDDVTPARHRQQYLRRSLAATLRQCSGPSAESTVRRGRSASAHPSASCGSSGGTGGSSGFGIVDLHRVAVEVRIGETARSPA